MYPCNRNIRCRLHKTSSTYCWVHGRLHSPRFHNPLYKSLLPRLKLLVNPFRILEYICLCPPALPRPPQSLSTFISIPSSTRSSSSSYIGGFLLTEEPVHGTFKITRRRARRARWCGGLSWNLHRGWAQRRCWWERAWSYGAWVSSPDASLFVCVYVPRVCTSFVIVPASISLLLLIVSLCTCFSFSFSFSF